MILIPNFHLPDSEPLISFCCYWHCFKTSNITDLL